MTSDNETLQYDTDEICILKSNNQESLNLKYILQMTFIKILEGRDVFCSPKNYKTPSNCFKINMLPIGKEFFIYISLLIQSSYMK